MTDKKKLPVIGLTMGDINGIGPELILKVFNDPDMFEICNPVVFGSSRILNYYKKNIKNCNLNMQVYRKRNSIQNNKQLNIFNCWEEQIDISPGQLKKEIGQYAAISLLAGCEALKTKEIDALVTAPIHKSNIKSENFNFIGHTPFLKHFFNVDDVVMLMISDILKVSLATEHIPLKDVSKTITIEGILRKLRILNKSLKEDFLISRPKIAILGLNPHNGDDGLNGREEIEIILPSIRQAIDEKIFAFGPYSSDAFFAREFYKNFDATLAMYHDQGLIPFKSLSLGEGINYTAGLNAVRTSPGHGTAFDIAGKGMADEGSFRQAIFHAIDIFNNKSDYAEYSKNPLKKQNYIQQIDEDSLDNIKD